MARIPNYSDDQITLNAPIAEGSSWRASPDLSTDYASQANAKTLGAIADTANILAIKQQAYQNNMEYNDAVNQATMAIRDKYNELLDRKGENALHFDATKDKPMQKSVTEDWGDFTRDLQNSLIANATNDVVKGKLTTFCNETFPQYYAGVLDHQTKETDTAFLNSRAAIMQTSANSAVAALSNGNFNLGVFHIHQAQKQNRETAAFEGKTLPEKDASNTKIVDDIVSTTVNKISKDNPELAMNITNYFANSLSPETRESLQQTVAPAIGMNRVKQISDQIIADPAFHNPDGSLNVPKYKAEMGKYRGVLTSYKIEDGESGNIGARVLKAIGMQESPNSYTAYNSDGEAYGKYQFRKATWDREAKRAGVVDSDGNPVDWQSATPEQQEQVAESYAAHLYDTYKDAGLVAVAWYAGEGNANLYRDGSSVDVWGRSWDSPQVLNGNTYPSIRQYINEVSAKFNDLGGESSGTYNPVIPDSVFDITEKQAILDDNIKMEQRKKDISEVWAANAANIHSASDIDAAISNTEASLGYSLDPATKMNLLNSGYSTLGMRDSIADKQSRDAMNQVINDYLVNGTAIPDDAGLQAAGVSNVADRNRLIQMSSAAQQVKSDPSIDWRRVYGAEAMVKTSVKDSANKRGASPVEAAAEEMRAGYALDQATLAAKRQLTPDEIIAITHKEQLKETGYSENQKSLFGFTFGGTPQVRADLPLRATEGDE